MKFIWTLVALAIVVCVEAHRIQHPICAGTFYHVYMNKKVGWVGLIYANTEWQYSLHNMTVQVTLATDQPTNPRFLGSLKLMHFRKLNVGDAKQRWDLMVEVKYPRQDPIPDVISIYFLGDDVCNEGGKPFESRKPFQVKLFLEFNAYTKEERSWAVQLHDGNEDVECGTVDYFNIYQPLILHGKTLDRGTWPWLVAVYSYAGPRLGFQCGGTLISRKIVITAAHCFFTRYGRRIPTEDIILILGQYSLKRPYDDDTQIVYPDSINIHKGYKNRTAIDADIAVVVLAQKARYSTFVRPACLWDHLAPAKTSDIEGLKGSVAGWGRDEEDNYFTELPKRVDLPVVSDTECLRSNQAYPILTTGETYCAGWRNGTDGPCHGDSGSGMLFKQKDKWTLRGVVSTALTDKQTNSCDLNEYIIFTDVAKDFTRLNNITFQVNLATEELPESSFLGSLKLLHFYKLQSTLENQRWNLIVEVNYPRQDPLPDVTAVILNGDHICTNKQWDSPKPVKIKLLMEYNDYTKHQRFTAKIIPNAELLTPTARPFVADNRLGCDIPSYSVIRNDRIKKSGGGVAIVIKDSVKFDRLSLPPTRIIETIGVIISSGGQHSLKRPYDKGTQIVYPDSINIHKDYGVQKAQDSDIAVVVLAEAIHYTTYIRPACLWTGSVSKDALVGFVGSIAGWGRDEEGNFYTELPRRAELPVVSDADCLRSNQAFPKLTSEVTFCAGARNGSGPCSGDSGGGFLLKRNNKWTVRGIVSLALTDRETDSCNLNEYVIFTDIVTFIPWIETFLIAV
ncbi:hypothetical protein DMENIID0001_132810 [Sergentomyia squamirostris]